MGNGTGVDVRAPEAGSVARWVEEHCGLHMPARAMCAGHSSPAEYLEHVYAEGLENGDCVVWACRGGGKTQLGAVATLLDMLFKPGIQVRILGGSMEQSSRMYEHLRRLMWKEEFQELVEGRMLAKGFSLKNGSKVELLAQSDRAVRGQRVQKLRCDEVELFSTEVWEAAQLITRSVEDTNGAIVRGRVEALSTMHLPGGLMQNLVAQSPMVERKVFSWCVWDVVEKCPEERPCETCPLWEECRGRAKGADGFVRIDDLITMKRRVSPGVWEREMLCAQPTLEDAIFAGFSKGQNVRAFTHETWGKIEGCEVEWFCGVDFGFVGAFVCLWFAVERSMPGDGNKLDRRIWVWDELVTRRVTVEGCVRLMMGREPTVGLVRCVGADSAGNTPNAQTAICDMNILRKYGYNARGVKEEIRNGLERIRGLLQSADGTVRLVIHPQCKRLIAAMEGYRANPRTGEALKDGVHDHLIDALRYGLLVCGDGGTKYGNYLGGQG